MSVMKNCDLIGMTDFFFTIFGYTKWTWILSVLCVNVIYQLYCDMVCLVCDVVNLSLSNHIACKFQDQANLNSAEFIRIDKFMNWLIMKIIERELVQVLFYISLVYK